MDACLAVSVYQKEEHCKVKNRKQPCAFCCKMVFQMPRHLKRVHRDVPEVANADSQSLRKIIGVGIFKHNIEVLKAGRGQLIVSRVSEQFLNGTSAHNRPFQCHYMVLRLKTKYT